MVFSKYSFKLLLFGFFYLLLCSRSFSQNGPKKRVTILGKDTIPSLDLGPDTTSAPKKKKKKVKKKIFYGLKTKKGFTKSGKRKDVVIDLFYYLKKYQEPDPNVKDIYLFDIRARKIIEVNQLDPKDKMKYKILHGPYSRSVGGVVIEQGIFYVGTKHGRWEKYNKNNILIDKSKYYKGWPKDAEITYYDAEHKKVQEVMPYRYGVLHGDYYYILENGQVLTYGKYMEGHKVGLWIEYYKDKNRRRKETQYPRTPYVEQFEPYVLNEWNDQGDPIIKNGKPFEMKHPEKIRKSAPGRGKKPKATKP